MCVDERPSVVEGQNFLILEYDVEVAGVGNGENWWSPAHCDHG